MEPTFREIDDLTLRALAPPGVRYFLVVGALFTAVAAFGLAWIYQVRTGMGVAGISHPVGWGVYIANFVFWIGIAHSGTLISAILHLLRAKWRDAVSRAAEAMTIFAIMTAGLFPLVHLGRLWVFYYIIPYPSQRQIWPNFISPLVWDLLAVLTYFTVSLIFFWTGLIPDAAAARDHSRAKYGPQHWRTRLYRFISLGWSGTSQQWRHYDRSYLFFAALATPLVVSVHSIVSWDFAVSLLPGWHTTLFAPYFVAGAIHSGLAMVLFLMIPLRRLLGLERLVTAWHLEKVAQTLLVTTAIMAYSYLVEPFIAWYSGNTFERQFALWRATAFDRPTGWVYWSLFLLNVLAPLTFVLRRARRSVTWLFLAAIAVLTGMWLERYLIVTSATAHDFLPHNWGRYLPTWVEVTITLGTAGLFLFLFFVFSRTLPVMPMTDLKSEPAKEAGRRIAPCPKPARRLRGEGTVLAVFNGAEAMLEAVRHLCASGFTRVETFSPVKLPESHRILGHRRSPVRFWTLAGTVGGAGAGFALAIFAALVNGLIVGGKHPIALIPYCIVGFELAVLGGSVANLAGMIFHARLLRLRPHPAYDSFFGRDRFGVLVQCRRGRIEAVQRVLLPMQPEEIRVHR